MTYSSTNAVRSDISATRKFDKKCEAIIHSIKAAGKPVQYVIKFQRSLTKMN